MHTILIAVSKVLFVISSVGGIIYSTWSEGPLPCQGARFVVMSEERWYYVDDIGDDLNYCIFHYNKQVRIAKFRNDVVLLDMHAGQAYVGSQVDRWWPGWEEQLATVSSIREVVVIEEQPAHDAPLKGA